jgi:hypothetical protein
MQNALPARLGDVPQTDRRAPAAPRAGSAQLAGTLS